MDTFRGWRGDWVADSTAGLAVSADAKRPKPAGRIAKMLSARIPAFWAIYFSRLNQLLQRLPVRGRTVLVSCIYGLVAGAAAVAFQQGINQLYSAGLLRLSHDSMATF